MLIPHKATNPSIVQRSPNSKFLQEVGGEETPKSFDTPTELLQIEKTMQTLLDANAFFYQQGPSSWEMEQSSEHQVGQGQHMPRCVDAVNIWLTL